MFFSIKVFYEKNLVTVLVKNSIQVPTTSVCPVFTRPLHDAGLTSAYPSVTVLSTLKVFPNLYCIFISLVILC